MTYILEPKGGPCFLCRALSENDDRTNLVLKRGATCAVVMNRYPYNNGHLMVCPKRHLAELSAMSAEERLETMDLVDRAVRGLRAVLSAEGFNIGINIGPVAGVGLAEHLHTHIVPRWNGDTNFMPVTADIKVVPQALLDVWDILHPALND
jgi:ATP adenylyltransferase